MTAIALVGGAALIETGAALVDTLNPDLLHDDPYYIDTVISCIQIAVLSYESGFVLNALLPQIVTSDIFVMIGVGAGFWAAAAVAIIVIPSIQSYLSDQPNPAEILGDTGNVEVTWAAAPSHERNQTIYLAQLVCAVAAFLLVKSPFFLALAAAHYLSFDLVKDRLDLCFSWLGETGAPVSYRQLLTYSIDYYVPLFNEIPLLLQWFGQQSVNTECPICHEELQPEERSTIYTYEGTKVDTECLIKHLKKSQEHLLDNWKWSVHHYVTYTQYGRHDSFTVDLVLPEQNKPSCPGDVHNLGHMEFMGYTPYSGNVWPAPLDYLTWAAPKTEESSKESTK